MDRTISVAVAVVAAVVLSALAANPLVAQPRPDLLKDVCVLRLPGMEKVVVRPNLVFKQAGERRLAFDLYLPPGTKAGGASAGGAATRLPVVVFANGVGDFGEIPLKDWAIYTSWARLTAVSGMAAVVHNARPDAAAEDLADLMKHLRAQAGDLKIDPDNIGVWACSANVRTALPYMLDPANRFIRSTVVYYGQLDPGLFRADLPMFIGRAGLDQAFTNNAMDRYAARAIAENGSVTVANLPNGRHAFDLVDDNDASRAIVKQTLAFMKETLSPGYQRAQAERPEQVRALAMKVAKDWPAAAEAAATWVKNEPGNGYAQQTYAEALYNLRQFPEAAATYAKAGDMGAIPSITWYNAACSYALAGDKEMAVELLTKAFGTGYITQKDQVRADPDLAGIKDDPRFVALVGTAAP